MIEISKLSERDRGRLVRYLPTGAMGTVESWNAEAIEVSIQSAHDVRPDGGVATTKPAGFRVRVKPSEVEWWGGEICDFCSGAPVVHTFPCRDFDIPLVGRSRGGFMACDTCRALVQMGAREWLADRALEQHRSDPHYDLLRVQVRALHDAFFEHRLPEPAP